MWVVPRSWSLGYLLLVFKGDFTVLDKTELKGKKKKGLWGLNSLVDQLSAMLLLWECSLLDRELSIMSQGCLGNNRRRSLLCGSFCKIIKHWNRSVAGRQMRVRKVNSTRKVPDRWWFSKDQPLVSKGNCCAFWLMDIDEKSISLRAAEDFISEAIGGSGHRYVT